MQSPYVVVSDDDDATARTKQQDVVAMLSIKDGSKMVIQGLEPWTAALLALCSTD